MDRGKRVLDDVSDEEREPKRRRLLALANELAKYIAEAFKVHIPQIHRESLEPKIHGAVSEAVERALPKLEPYMFANREIVEALKDFEVRFVRFEAQFARHYQSQGSTICRMVNEAVQRALPKTQPSTVASRSFLRRTGPEGRNLQLRFEPRLFINSLRLYAGKNVTREARVRVELIDVNSGHHVTSGPESSMELVVVALKGDFNHEDGGDWTKEEFERNIVKERPRKRPLLIGDLQVILKDGVRNFGEVIFTDNSSWAGPTQKFRLGVRVPSGFCEGTRIREAVTEAFKVVDSRGELDKKHYPPALDDEVWRLEMIGKDGRSRSLNKAEIHNVRDFLRLAVRDSKKLKNILGNRLQKHWDVIIAHAETCELSTKRYVYYADNMKRTGVILNEIYKLLALVEGGQYYPVENLSGDLKVLADMRLKKAYDDYINIIEFDGLLPFNMEQSNEACTSSSKVLSAYPVSEEQDSMHTRLAEQGILGYENSFGKGYPNQSQHLTAQMPQDIQFLNYTYFTPSARNNSTQFESLPSSSYSPNFSCMLMSHLAILIDVVNRPKMKNLALEAMICMKMMKCRRCFAV